MGIKDFFSKKNKQSEYEGKNISGGNIYETHIQQEIRNSNMLNNTPSGVNNSNIVDTLQNLTNNLWTNLTVNEWTLLKLNSDYFLNMIKFKANNTYLFRTIQNVIKCAYIYGVGAVYIKSILGSDPKFRVVVPMNIKTNIYGEIEKLEIINFNETILNNGYTTPELLKPTETITLQEDINNIIIFKWGTNAIDSFQRILPFVKYQSELLNMIVTASYGFIKKYDLIYNGKEEEIKGLLTLFFNSKNPFNIRYSNIDISSKITPLQVPHQDTNNYVSALLDFYKQSTGIMYGLNGRRSNQDNKRERNVTSEVEASQAQFDNLEYNILNEFEIFTNEFNKNEQAKKGNYRIEFEQLFNRTENNSVSGTINNHRLSKRDKENIEEPE